MNPHRIIVNCTIDAAERIRFASGLTMADVSFAGLVGGRTSVAWTSDHGQDLAVYLAAIFGEHQPEGE